MDFSAAIRERRSIERFPLFSFQRLWNNICHEKELLNENIPRKIFALNLKKEFLKTICQNINCNECT